MKSSGINNLKFNQDHGCFSCSMNQGFRIYNIEPLTEKIHQGGASGSGSYFNGDVKNVEMLYRTNLLSIIGTGVKHDINTVHIWDDSRKQDNVVVKLIYDEPVISTRLRRDMLVVILRSTILVYSFPNDFKQLYSFATRDNPFGIAEISQNRDRHLLFFPGMKMGSIQYMDLSTSSEGTQSISPMVITAHQSAIACITLNQDASLLASASKQGTLIRIFNINTKRKLMELRRGTDPATLYCINFSQDSSFLCVSSDKGTVHIFAINNTQLNKKSSLKRIGFLGDYVDSQWGLASFTVAAECSCICAFGSSSTIYAICIDGTFHKYSFSIDGVCHRQTYDVFLDIGNNIDF